MEIERKFLTTLPPDTDSIIHILTTEYKVDVSDIHVYVLYRATLYSNTDGSYSRVTKKVSPWTGVDYMLTVKGPGTLSRAELDVPITEQQYLHTVTDFKAPIYHKTRIVFPYQELNWEIDLFNDGLVLVEIELRSEIDNIPSVPFLGIEVTHDLRYTNYIQGDSIEY